MRADAVLAEVEAAAGRSGAESLLPGVDAVLREASVSLDDVEAFAVSIGPGSFTGLRVGVATVKGLCFGTGRLVAAVPTLAALSAGVEADDVPVVALLDAQRGEVYAALFRAGGPDGLPQEGEPDLGVYTPDDLAVRLPERCHLVGEGLGVCGERLRALGGAGVVVGEPRAARAADVGRLGRRMLAGGAGMAAADLVPRYVRRAQAEVDRTGARFE